MNEPRKSKLAELVGSIDQAPGRKPTAADLDRIAGMPSREEPEREEGFVQVNLKLRPSVRRRFKEAAREAGGQAKAFEQMMDLWEGR